MSRSSTRQLKRTSPPSASMRRRSALTTAGRRVLPGARGGERLLLVEIDAAGPGGAGDDAGLVFGDDDLGCVDEIESVFVARVEGLAEDAPAQQVRRRHPEDRGQPARQLGFRRV